MDQPPLFYGFTILRHIGAGGMGEVLLVQNDHTGSVFAAKRIKPGLLQDSRYRLAFLAELMGWASLPPHPHLTAFRFFRSDGAQMIIFTEYIDGGDLVQWRGRTARPSVSNILDFAAQIARGLAAAHSAGVVHQDLTPQNVLLTADGTVKLTDFGLAAFANQSRGESWQALQTGGGNPLFAAPEQISGGEITPATDAWGWALTLLALSSGAATWTMNLAVPRQLDEHFAYASNALDRPLPKRFQHIIARCLQLDPQARPRDLTAVAAAVERIYNDNGPAPYQPRCERGLDLQHDAISTDHSRRTATGVPWDDPELWFDDAVDAGRWAEREAVGVNVLPQPRSLKARALRDIAIYQESRELFSEAMAKGELRARSFLAVVSGQQGIIHHHLGDVSGALALFSEAIALLTVLVEAEGKTELVDELAKARLNQALILAALGAWEQARDLLTAIIADGEPSPPSDLRCADHNILGLAHYHRSVVNRELHCPEQALADAASAIDHWQHAHPRPDDSVLDLALGHLAQGGALVSLGRYREALSSYDHSLDVLRCASDLPSQPLLMAVVFLGRAEAEYNQTQIAESRRDVNRALHWLVSAQQTCPGIDVAAKRGSACGLAGKIELASNQPRQALRWLHSAVALWQRLVNDAGQTCYCWQLAAAQLTYAETAALLGDNEPASAAFQNVTHLLESFSDPGRPHIRQMIDRAREGLTLTRHKEPPQQKSEDNRER